MIIPSTITIIPFAIIVIPYKITIIPSTIIVIPYVATVKVLVKEISVF